MITLVLFLFVSAVCMASSQQVLIIACLIDAEYGDVSYESRTGFMLRARVEAEYRQILDYLPFAYQKHFNLPVAFIESHTQKNLETLPLIKEFVDGMPAVLWSQFVLIPPGQLRQEMRERLGGNLLPIIGYLEYYSFPLGPYLETLSIDLMVVGDNPWDLFNIFMRAKLEESLSNFRETKVHTAFLNISLRIFRFRFDDLKMWKEFKKGFQTKMRDLNYIGSLFLKVTSENSSSSIKQSPKGHDENHLVWGGVFPFDVECVILSQTCVAMRLVNKAAYHSRCIPHFLSDPIKFLANIACEYEDWKPLCYTLVCGYKHITREDVELIKQFVGSKLPPTYLQSTHDFDFQKEANLHKFNPAVRPQDCFWWQQFAIASLVFEQGSFGAHCDEFGRKQILAILKVYFPRQVVESLAAKKDYDKEGITRVFKDKRIPFEWAFCILFDIDTDAKLIMEDVECLARLRQFLEHVVFWEDEDRRPILAQLQHFYKVVPDASGSKLPSIAELDARFEEHDRAKEFRILNQ